MPRLLASLILSLSLGALTLGSARANDESPDKPEGEVFVTLVAQERLLVLDLDRPGLLEGWLRSKEFTSSDLENLVRTNDELGGLLGARMVIDGERQDVYLEGGQATRAFAIRRGEVVATADLHGVRLNDADEAFSEAANAMRVEVALVPDLVGLHDEVLQSFGGQAPAFFPEDLGFGPDFLLSDFADAMSGPSWADPLSDSVEQLDLDTEYGHDAGIAIGLIGMGVGAMVGGTLLGWLAIASGGFVGMVAAVVGIVAVAAIAGAFIGGLVAMLAILIAHAISRASMSDEEREEARLVQEAEDEAATFGQWLWGQSGHVGGDPGPPWVHHVLEQLSLATEAEFGFAN